MKHGGQLGPYGDNPGERWQVPYIRGPGHSSGAGEVRSSWILEEFSVRTKVKLYFSICTK